MSGRRVYISRMVSGISSIHIFKYSGSSWVIKNCVGSRGINILKI
jgi:hypothetical protein